MSAEQLHEIYDNDGTLVGYETAQIDPASGHFNRYDETRTLRGYAKNVGDLTHHFDKSMRLIGYARLEDGVLREYDRQNNVVGYQVRQDTDSADDQNDDRFSNGVGADTAHSATSVYAPPKSMTLTGNNWLGNRYNHPDEDQEPASAANIEQESLSKTSNTTPKAIFANDNPGLNYQPPSRNSNSSFENATPGFRPGPRYEEIVGDDDDGDSDSADNAYADVHNRANDPALQEEPTAYANGYNNWQQSARPAQAPSGYAMRGEIVDDVDEFGNEIDPNGPVPSAPFWENMPHLPQEGTGLDEDNNARTAQQPLARPSRFASKPSLIQRLLGQVMPFFASKPDSAPMPAPARQHANIAAALPAPEGSQQRYEQDQVVHNQPDTDLDMNDRADAYDARYGQDTQAGQAQNNAPASGETGNNWRASSASTNSDAYQPQTNARPSEEINTDEENFDPFAEFRILWQKIKFYTDRFTSKRKPSATEGAEYLDSRDAVLNDAASHSSYGSIGSMDGMSDMDGMSGMGGNSNAYGSAPASSAGIGIGLPDLLAFAMALPLRMRWLPGMALAGTLKAIQTPLWLWWMTASALGAIAFGMLRLFIPPIGDIPNWFYGGVYGLTMGSSQWVMLRHRYRTTAPWVFLTAAAGVVGTLLWHDEQSWFQPHNNGGALGEILTLYLAIGVAQWLLLRNLSSRATYWLLLSPLAGTLSWLAFQFGSVTGYMGALTAHGLMLGAVSGLALVHTLEDSSRSQLVRAPRNTSIIAAVTMLSGGIRALSAAIALGGLLEAISGHISVATQGGQAQQTPLLLALLSIYPARLFVSLASMGSALGYKQNESVQSRAWLVGASIAGIVVEIVAQIILPQAARPAGSLWFVLSGLVILILIDTLTPVPAAEEAPLHTTMTSFSAIGILCSGLLIFFASVFTAVHAVNVDLIASASLTADAVGFSLSMGTLISVAQVLLSGFAIFVALRLPGEHSNGWAEVPMGVLAIAAATFGPILLEATTVATATTAKPDQQWLAPIVLCGAALIFGLMRNAPSFGGALPTKTSDASSRAAPRLLPIGIIIAALSLGVVLSRNGTLTKLSSDPRLGVLVGKAQELRASVTAKVGQVQLPKSMSEVQQATSGIQKTVSDLLQKIQPTPEPTAEWPASTEKSK